MSYEDRPLLRTIGEPIPQYDDPVADMWRPWQGDADGPRVTVSSIGKATDEVAPEDLSTPVSGVSLWKGVLAVVRSIPAFLQQISDSLSNGIPVEGVVQVSNLPDVQVVSGLRAAEPFSGSTSAPHTFSRPMRGLVVYNDGVANLTLAVNGYTFTVPSGCTLEESFEPFVQVDIVASGPYYAYGRY